MVALLRGRPQPTRASQGPPLEGSGQATGRGSWARGGSRIAVGTPEAAVSVRAVQIARRAMQWGRWRAQRTQCTGSCTLLLGGAGLPVTGCSACPRLPGAGRCCGVPLVEGKTGGGLLRPRWRGQTGHGLQGLGWGDALAHWDARRGPCSVTLGSCSHRCFPVREVELSGARLRAEHTPVGRHAEGSSAVAQGLPRITPGPTGSAVLSGEETETHRAPLLARGCSLHLPSWPKPQPSEPDHWLGDGPLAELSWVLRGGSGLSPAGWLQEARGPASAPPG